MNEANMKSYDVTLAVIAIFNSLVVGKDKNTDDLPSDYYSAIVKVTFLKSELYYLMQQLYCY